MTYTQWRAFSDWYKGKIPEWVRFIAFYVTLPIWFPVFFVLVTVLYLLFSVCELAADMWNNFDD